VISRRGWLQSVVIAGGGALLARGADAQQPAAKLADTSNFFPMDQSAARSVRLAPKPGAVPSMTEDARDALEHQIRCQCGCTMDVYTCRTTDFSCQVSPTMHRDIMALVQGGHSAQEILDAFVDVYGERALMAPKKVGFNIVGYVLPGVVMSVGAVILAVILHRWNRRTAQTVGATAVTPPPLDATAEEIAKLDAAIRDDS